MTLNENVADFLLSDDRHINFAIEKLNFFIEDFHVDPEGYREVAQKVRQGALTVVAASRSGGSRTSAVYTALLDKISVSKNMDLSGTSAQAISQQAEIIHEMTHALMDYHFYQTTGTVQEIAAYMAGGLYARAHLQSLSSSQPDTAAILQNVVQIIQGRQMIIQRGVRLRLTDPDVSRLADAISSHPSYSNSDISVRSDGITGGLINPWYQPRHYEIEDSSGSSSSYQTNRTKGIIGRSSKRPGPIK
jgi:hypothetical protein